MSQSISEVGRRPVVGTTAENTAAVTPISTTAAIGIVLPAKPRVLSSGTGGTAGQNKLDGPLEVDVVVEGTAAFRYTTNGITPTGGVGQAGPTPTATAPVKITLRGYEVIKNFLIIGTGNTITYQFFCSEA